MTNDDERKRKLQAVLPQARCELKEAEQRLAAVKVEYDREAAATVHLKRLIVIAEHEIAKSATIMEKRT